MSLDTLAFAEQAGTIYTAEDMRSILALFANSLGRQLFGAFGDSIGFVATENDLVVSAGGDPGLSVTIGAGWALIATDGTAESMHMAHETSTTVVTDFDTADPSLPRVDLVCIHARDNELDAGGNNDAVYEIIEGTPGGGVPSDPGGQYIVLAEATVPAGATSGASIAVASRRVAFPVPLPFVAPVEVHPPEFAYIHYTPGANQDVIAGPAVWPTGLSAPVAVPIWARWAKCLVTVGQVHAVTDDLDHLLTLKLGGITVDTKHIGWDLLFMPTGTSAEDITIANAVDCTTVAGSTVVLGLLAQRLSGSGALRANANSTGYVEVVFFP